MIVQTAVMAAVATVLFLWFVRLERDDRREVVFAVVVVVFIVEQLLFQSQTAVPSGLFRVPFVAGDLRPLEILLPLAILARCSAPSTRKLFSTATFAWALFCAWYLSSGVIGYLYGNPTSEIVYQAKAVVSVFGGLVLAAGVRPQRIVEQHVFGWFLIVLSVVTGVLMIATTAGVSFTVNAPLLRIPQLGLIEADAQLLLPILGGIGLLVEGCRSTVRRAVLFACLVLLASPLAGTQAAAYLSVATLVGATALAATGATWRRRVRITPTEMGVAVAAVAFIALSMALTVVPSSLDLATQIDDTLLSESQGRTTSARTTLWGEAVDMIVSRPVIGSGLGIQQSLRPEYDPFNPIQVTSHNVAIDVAVRSGLVGLLLFLASSVITVQQGIATWRQERNPEIAALALGALVGLSALLANAMVVSSLERFRHAGLLGLLVGIIAACAAHRDNDGDDFARAYVGGRRALRTTTRPSASGET